MFFRHSLMGGIVRCYRLYYSESQSSAHSQDPLANCCS